MNVEDCARMGTKYAEEQQKLAEKMQIYFREFGEITVDKLAGFVAGYALAHPEELQESIAEHMALSLVKGIQASGVELANEIDLVTTVTIAARRRMVRICGISGGE